MRDQSFIIIRRFPEPFERGDLHTTGYYPYIAGLIIHAVLFFRFTTVSHKGKPTTTCFYHLRRILLRAHGTLLVRAIKKRNAPWSGRVSRSRISATAAPQRWKKNHLDVDETTTAFVHTYMHARRNITVSTIYRHTYASFGYSFEEHVYDYAETTRISHRLLTTDSYCFTVSEIFFYI